MDRRHSVLLLILVTSSANAEVSDKIASIPNMWAVAFSFGLVASTLTLWKKWFFLLGAAVSALYFSATLDLSADKHLAAAIIVEQGSFYFAHSYITSLIPFAMVCLALIYLRKRKARCNT